MLIIILLDRINFSTLGLPRQYLGLLSYKLLTVPGKNVTLILLKSKTGANIMTSNTRDRVLKSLLLNQRSSVNDLAEAVGINPISVRHHVNKLEAEGLIQSEEERHGVGRPRLVYSLTEKGMEQFPKRYLNLTLRLLAQIKDNLSEKKVGEIFQDIAVDLADSLTEDLQLESLDLDERMDVLQKILTSEGFTVSVTEDEENFYLIEASCPYHHVGQDFPEICALDQALITHITSVSPHRIECILNGDQQCKYRLEKPKAEVKA